MQSYVMAFFPNISAAKQEMHSLYRNYAHMFDMSPDHAGMGCHITTRTMGGLPVLLIDQPVFLTGSMIRTIAIHYRALIDRWLLRKFAVIQGAPIYCTMILRSCWGCRTLPFFVGIGVLTARLYNCVKLRNQIYGRQLILGHDANLEGDLLIENNLSSKQSSPPSFLGSKHHYACLLLQCICSIASLKVHTIPKVIGFDRRCIQNNHESSAFWKIMARNEQYLTYIGALVTLQLFFQLTRVNITTSLLPMLFQTTNSRGKAAVVSNIVLVLVNSCGILGSAFTTKQYGREVTLTISAVLMIFCQITIPLIVEVQIGLGGGTRMPTGYTTAMFVLTCVVSCGLSWSWGSLFWTFTAKKIQSAGQVVGMALNFALCFAQMQYFLLMLCRLKNAILAYYATWIWS